MSAPILIAVRNWSNGSAVHIIERTQRLHHGWTSVTYKGRRYQVFGGIRGPVFIDLSNPIKGRAE